jgi:hypothetical protein
VTGPRILFANCEPTHQSRGDRVRRRAIEAGNGRID